MSGRGAGGSRSRILLLAGGRHQVLDVDAAERAENTPSACASAGITTSASSADLVAAPRRSLLDGAGRAQDIVGVMRRCSRASS